MSEIKLLQKRIQSNMNKYTRTAILAECGDRVIDIYKKLGDETDKVEVARSIEIGWDYACNKPIDKSEYQACLKVVHDTASFYIEVDDEPLSSLLLLVERILQSLSTNEDESCFAVARGLYSIIDVANYAEEMADEETPIPSRERVARREEIEWREKAIILAEKWDGIADRNMFDSLGGKPPNWYLDWEKRCEVFFS